MKTKQKGYGGLQRAEQTREMKNPKPSATEPHRSWRTVTCEAGPQAESKREKKYIRDDNHSDSSVKVIQSTSVFTKNGSK